jgi:hypothetical protein
VGVDLPHQRTGQEGVDELCLLAEGSKGVSAAKEPTDSAYSLPLPPLLWLAFLS